MALPSKLRREFVVIEFFVPLVHVLDEYGKVSCVSTTPSLRQHTVTSRWRRKDKQCVEILCGTRAVNWGGWPTWTFEDIVEILVDGNFSNIWRHAYASYDYSIEWAPILEGKGGGCERGTLPLISSKMLPSPLTSTFLFTQPIIWRSCDTSSLHFPEQIDTRVPLHCRLIIMDPNAEAVSCELKQRGCFCCILGKILILLVEVTVCDSQPDSVIWTIEWYDLADYSNN